jgi:hypothetical protein
MPKTITIAFSAALLLAAAASATSAAAREATNGTAFATLCTELSPFPQSGHHCLGPHCLSFNLSDRTVGPTFPTACRQTT